ncbi:MAG: alanine dehydrogenase [Planctomycetes bacterium]|nr:alanine dehydrogenase [Planctomycetota bacterium]MDP6425193.1 alanine dehydrogenase [Planctomycetota bacterium]
MIVGVPKEIKPQEGRVGMVPAGVEDLIGGGHEVLIERGAGLGSGIADDAYTNVGGRLVDGPDEVWSAADLIVKVKEPIAPEWPRMRAGQTLFTYFHLAASRELTDAMLKTGSTCFAYETVDVPGSGLILLEPMSEVAGRMAVQEGAYHLELPYGGNGVLLGGVPGVEPGKVLILGGGTVGTEAARMAAGLGAQVVVLDINLERLRWLSYVLPPNVQLVHSSPYAIKQHLPTTDLLVGAVLVKGARAPMLVRRADLVNMKQGAVIVDVAVDQGGCIETVRPTTHENPTFVVDGVVHYCVANMPGAVPRTSTFALTAATKPWVERLAKHGARAVIETDESFRGAASVVAGKLTDPAVAASFGVDYVSPLEALTA